MALARFLLTRFNAPVRYAPGGLGITDEWLEHRFHLFENFCLPSVCSQDNRDFSWIILIDQRTPAGWVTRLSRGVDSLGPAVFVRPVSDSWHERNVRNLVQEIAAKSAATRIVTTRLDNDDAIVRDYLSSVAFVAASLPSDGDYVINFLDGCRIDQSGIFARSMPMNPFISLVSSAANLRTVFHGNHLKLANVGTVVNIGGTSRDPIKWMQVNHERNVTKLNAGSEGLWKRTLRWWQQRKRRRDRPLDESALAMFSLGPQWKRLLSEAVV